MGHLEEPQCQFEKVSLSFGVNTTAEVSSYIICMAFMINSGMPYACSILEKFIPVNGVEGFPEVSDDDSSLFLIVMYFLNDVPENKDSRRCRLNGSKTIWIRA